MPLQTLPQHIIYKVINKHVLSEWMLNKFPGNFFNMHTMSSQVAQLVKYLSACKGGDLGLTPESGKSPGKENGNPLQYSCWRFYGQRSLEDYSPWDMDTTE